jgi:bifunctional non-homologous end joining protein LigD
VKYDGYRVLIWRDGRQVRITSRGNQDWSAKLAGAVRAAGELSCRRCILDGELVALDGAGHSSFARLQQFFGADAAHPQLRIVVFDLLFLDNEDLRPLAQIERKRRLARLLRGAHPPLELAGYTLGNGAEAARAACAQALEGIVSKLAAASYVEGRTGAWLKIKCVDSDEYVILGYTSGQGARERLGSLLLGSPAEDARWRYRGRVGTGLDEATIGSLLGRLQPAAQPPRLVNPPTRAQLRGATPIWVHPRAVVEVEFRGYTDDGLLRQASLKGVRQDRRVDSLRPSGRDRASVTRDRE